MNHHVLTSLRAKYMAELYKNVPPHARPKKSYPNTANGLTAMITDFFRYQGAPCMRVNVTGLPVGIDPRTRKIRWRRSGATKGMSDLVATFRGKTLHIEIKWKNDKPSTAQIDLCNAITAQGGIYIFVHTFDEFINHLERLNLWNSGQ